MCSCMNDRPAPFPDISAPQFIRPPGMAAVQTTAWRHDSMDGGGRAASGTAAEEVGQRREQLPTTAWMQEVGQRREQLPTTAWMQEVGQRREQLPRRSPDKPPTLPGSFNFIATDEYRSKLQAQGVSPTEESVFICG